VWVLAFAENKKFAAAPQKIKNAAAPQNKSSITKDTRRSVV
jgi:hypothetical protein